MKARRLIISSICFIILAAGASQMQASATTLPLIPLLADTSSTFYSAGAQDGWVLESSETSNLGKTIDSASTTLRVGDDSAKKQYRSILSFNTSALPDNAVITSAKLSLRQQVITGGGNPFTTFQGMLIDVKKGYFGTAVLQAADFQSAANLNALGPFLPVLTTNYTFTLSSNSYPYINKVATNSGLTQFRLRFKLDDNNNSIANYISFYSGNFATQASRPKLLITWHLPDSSPPAAITNLTAQTGLNNGSVNLTWTAPGDDEDTGTATSYLVRYSANVITNETEWSSATTISTGVPTPAVAGTVQQMAINGLVPDATYHFAVRARDEVLNLAALSNDASATASHDVIPPAQIGDLVATPGTQAGTVNLSWTAPGNDGWTGTAAAYLVRYSLNQIIDEPTWSAATVVSGTPAPHPGGTPAEHMTVSGLSGGATYYFAVRAVDETPNISALSNDVSAVPLLPADLTILKSHTGDFRQGQSGKSYVISVSNIGDVSTAGTVTVVDQLPSGLIASAMSGSGWSCALATLTCTRGDVLASGTNYPTITLTINVSNSAPASLTNTASVSGGGELNTSNNSSQDSTNIIQTADLTVTKTHSGNFRQGQTSAIYTITVTNSGLGGTDSTVTLVDTVPTGLTVTGISGTGWTCTLATLSCTRSDVLAASASYPAITLTVNVANNAAVGLTNTVTVSGGGELNTSNDTANDVTTVTRAADLAITKTHTGNFRQGQNAASYSITVTNNGLGQTISDVSVVDTLPTGLTATAMSGTGWTCTLTTLMCTRSDALVASASYPAITLAVDVANNAPTSLTNTASVSGGGELNTANNTANDSTTIVQAADLAVTKTHTGNFREGQTGATYTITVTNSGPGPTAGAVSMVDTLPTGLAATAISGTGWTCTLATRTCTRSDALAAAASYPAITLTVTVANNVASSLTNTATVSGGGELNTSNDTANDLTTVAQVADLTVAKTHTGNFRQGDAGDVYTLTVTNSGLGSTTGTVTVVDTLPTGLTATGLTGTGWACTLATLTCTRSDVLAAAASYPTISLTVNVANSAAASLTNTASVSGGGELVTNNNTANDLTTVVQAADLTITKTHAGNFQQGQIAATYTVTVTNSGAGPTVADVSVVDTLPTGLTATGLTGTGWTCTLGTLTCTRSDALAAAASYPAITLTVDVANNALASVTNIATVSGGGELNGSNDVANDPTAVVQAADLTITKTHAGNFRQGQSGATYTITVTNSGPGPTAGIVSVVDMLPSDLTATAINGTGWSCTLATLTCTRSNALASGASDPAITLTVNVANNAAATITNTTTVSGGGELNASNDTASDPTTVALAADLTITKTHTGNFRQGQTAATYTITVTNSGLGPTISTVTAKDTMPTGLTATAISGTGWTCTLGTLTCTRSDALAASTSYSAITLTVNIANNAAPSLTNIATVSGGGELNTGNDTANDPTTVTQAADLTITKTHTGNFRQGQTAATYTLTVSNSGPGSTVGTVTAVDTLPTGLSATDLNGTGWSCTLATLTCTRSDVLAASASYPGIILTVNVANNAAPSLTNIATVSGGGELNTSNDATTDPTTIALAADLTVTKTHTGNFRQGQTAATYTITVTNGGLGPTIADVSVVDTMPPGLTATAISGTGWTCILGTLTCTRSDPLAASASYPTITLTVDLANDAAPSLTNTATVSGGGELNTGNDTASNPTTVIQVADLTITKTHTGNLRQGQTSATYTLTISNSGPGPTVGTATVVDTLPTGLTATGISGTGWNCTLATLTCTRSDVLAISASYPAITLTVNVANNAAISLTNTATVSGGGELNTSNDTANDSTTIVQVADLTITKTHTGNFRQGQLAATYTITVTNSGPGPTDNSVSVVDTLPTGLTATSIAGTGWTCTLGTLTCTRSDALAVGASYPTIALTVNVANNAAASLTNTATVSGGGELNTSNDTATDPTTVTQVADLTISKTHTGNFRQGQTAANYTVTVSNSGPGSTDSPVSIVDTLPSGLTATDLGGTGWNCTLATLTCTRSDVLAISASYPAITLTVNVANNAGASLTNTATVSGGGELNASNDAANDPTTVTQAPDLTISKTHSGNFRQGQLAATYTITVNNSGLGPTVGDVSVADVLPTGLTPTAISGTGWTCTLGTLTCSRSDALAASVSYPTITLTVSVANDAPASLTNTASVSGGGELIIGNDSASDLTTITSDTTTVGGAITSNTTWTAANSPYTVTSDVTINAGITLTIQPGTVVRFNSSTGIVITTTGTLNAVGTSASPILFTANSASPTAGYWKGISFGATSANSILDHATVEFGGNGGNGNIRTSGAVIQLKNGTIRKSSNYGVYGTGLAGITMSGNNFNNNGDFAATLVFINGTFTANDGNSASANGKGVMLLGGTLAGTNTLAANPTLPYSFSNSLTVNSGATLTLQPGVVFKPFSDTYCTLNVSGTLNAQGTSGSPIFFTSLKDDSIAGDSNNDGSASSPAGNDWGTIRVLSGGSVSLNYTTVRYGGSYYDGGGYDYANLGLEGGSLSINNSTISNSGADGIRNYTGNAATLSITNSSIRNNVRYGVNTTNSSAPTIQNSSFSNNGQHGLYMQNVGTLAVPNSTFSSNGQRGLYATGITTGSVTNSSFTGNGDFAATLVFTNGTFTANDGNSASANGKGVMLLGGTLAGTNTLAANPTLPYSFSNSLTVNSGATLTLQPGVVFKPFSDTYCTLNVSGTLNAQGTSGSPIFFTSLKDDSIAGDSNNDGSASSPAGNDWGTIRVLSGGSVSLNYTTVRYGGSYYDGGGYDYANLGLEGGSLSINNSTISNSGADGIRNYTGNAATLSITNSSIRNNVRYGVNTTNSSAPTIQNSSFSNNGQHGLYMQNVGTLAVPNSTFSSNGQRGLYATGITTGSVTNSSFTGNGDFAATLVFTNGTFTANDGNSASANGKGVMLLGGTLAGTNTLAANPTLPYSFSNSLTVNSGATLTLQPGVVFKPFSDTYCTLNVSGTLNAQGTSGSPIFFTSLKDDSIAGDSNNDGSASSPAGNDWGTIRVLSGGSVSLNYTTVRYGGSYYDGGGYDYANLGLEGGSLSINNSTISNSGADGIRNYTGNAATLSITNSSIRNNVRYGVNTTNSSAPTIQNSSFSNNGQHGLYMQNVGTLAVPNSTFSSNGQRGLYATGITTGSVTNSSFTGNGDFAATLVFTNGTFTANDGNSASANGKGVMLLGGTLAGTNTLAANPTLPYSFSNSLTVNSGATLTLQPGVVFKPFSDTYCTLNVSGTLNAQGTSGSPIFFTSLKDDSIAGDSNNDGSASSPAGNDWGTIRVLSGGSVSLNYTTVRYGGSYYDGGGYDYANLGLEGGSLSINNSTISNSGADGIRNYTGNAATLSITNSSIRNNVRYGVNTTNSSAPTIQNSSFSNNGQHGLYMQNVGTLAVPNSTFSSNGQRGLYATGITTGSVTNSSFTGNGDFAATLVFTNGTFTANDGNSASANGKGVMLLGGTLAGTNTLAANPTLPYSFSNSLTVNSGATLTLQPGVVFKPFSDTYCTLNVSGTLNAQGTSGSPIFFTSLKDDSIAGDSNNDGSASSPAGNDWGTIRVLSGGSVSLNYTTVRYGGSYYDGGGYDYANLGLEGGSLSINNSTISNSGADGIRNYTGNAATLSITNSSIRNNVRHGVNVSNVNPGTISGSSIYSNGQYGIYNGNTAITISAENNWWGSGTGPKPYGSGNGINYHTVYNSACKCNIIDKYYVDANPWGGGGIVNGQSAPWVAQVAEPVNTATGNYSYEHTDLSIPTRSLPLAFSHSYNSSAPANGLLGYGWTFSYNVYITESSLDNSATITYGDGRTVRFDWNGTSYVPPAGTFSTLVKSGGLFTLTEKNQTVNAFNASNKLSTITDKNGNVTTLNYPGTLLGSVTAADGRILSFTYDGSSRITSVTDPLSRTLGFAYDSNGDLTSFTDVMHKVTTYTYDGNHRLTSITDANHHTFVTNTYDTDGRVSQQRDASTNLTTFTYDIDAHNTFVTDPRGKTTTYGYDASLRLIKVTDHLGNYEAYTWDGANNRLSFRDKRGNTTYYTYDSRGNLLTATNPLSGIATNTYDAYNNLLTHTDERTKTTTYTYDVHNNLETKKDAKNGLTQYTYYPDTNRKGLLETVTAPLLQQTTYDYNAHGDLTSITDALTHTSTRTYDDGGRLLTSSDPLTHTTTYTYDNANRILTVEDPETDKTINTYDDVGNLLTRQDPLGHITARTYTVKDELYTVEDAEHFVTTYGYDSVGNKTSVKDGNNHTTTYTYDDLNRLWTVVNPLGKTTTFGYDANGNRTSVTDANTHTTTYTFDVLNRQTVVKDALNHTTTTAYDAVGNVLSVTDANTHATTYTYDDLNRLETVTDALNGVVTYTYDAVGNRLTMEDANHHTTTYTYDKLSRLLTEKDPLNHVWTNTYDWAGRRSTRVDPNIVTTTYTYDKADRLTGISAPSISITYGYDLAGNRISLTDTTGSTTYYYDNLNRPTSIVQPSGTIGYGYDAVNRTSLTLPGALTTTYVYDAADHLMTAIDWASRATGYIYDNAGRQITTTDPNGVVSTNTYDIADRLTGISTVKGTTTVFLVTYTLDNVGNRLTMVDGMGTTTYTYDELNRLKTVAYPTGSPANVSYTYDAMGNRLTMVQDGVTTNYSYDNADRLTGTTGGSTLTFTWDNNGQMLTKGAQTFSWDVLGRMISLSNAGTSASYAYNGDGVRTRKTVDGTSTTYLQDLAAGLPVVMAETTGTNTTQYVYGSDLIAQVNGATPSYYHSDGLGSTRALTDSTGVSIDQYNYDAFGASRSHVGSSAQAFTYAGEQVDPEAGLQFLRARYYDPTEGRFISRDSFAGLSVDPQSLNRFPYAKNNPTIGTDPSGKFINFLIGGAIGAVAGFGTYAISTAITGEQWNWGKAAVYTGAGAAIGVAGPLALAAISSGAITGIGALTVGEASALVAADVGLWVGAGKEVLNEQIDQKRLNPAEIAGSGIMDAISVGFSPSGWANKLVYGLSTGMIKQGIKRTIWPKTVYAPSSDATWCAVNGYPSVTFGDLLASYPTSKGK